MRKVLAGLISAAAVLAFGSHASASPSICDATAGNLVSNCGFELSAPFGGQAPDWTFTAAAQGSDSTVTNVGPNSGAQAYSFGAADLADDTLSQLLVTNAGTQYTFAFYYEPSGGPFTHLMVNWDNDTLFEVFSPAGSGYMLHSFTVTGTGSDTISFAGYNDDFVDLLDDVSVVANSDTHSVPEPLTLCLFGAGLAGIAAVRRRKARTA